MSREHIPGRRRGPNKVDKSLTGATREERLEIEVRTQQVLREKIAPGTRPRNDDRREPGPRPGRVFHHPDLAREA